MSCKYAVLLFLFSLLLAAEILAQGPPAAARPDRGAVNGNSYAVSDIEKVNLTNGNVNLSIPLAGLPPIAGGKLSWTLSAVYNSKLWNVMRREEVYHTTGWNTYAYDSLQVSDLGGWRIGGVYQIYIRHAQEDYDYKIPPANSNSPDQYLMATSGWWKVMLRTPDGAEHELRPTDYQPFSGETSILKGYYNVIPTGTNSLRYYSYDGTYLSALITSESNWTVFMPDGTQIIQNSGIQRIKDTNGNSIKIFAEGNVTHYQDEQTQREVKLTWIDSANNGLGQWQISYQTVGGTWMSIEINMGTTRVQGKVYPVNQWSSIGGELGTGVMCQRDEEIIPTDILVVREIVLPQTEPGQQRRKFTFSYNSDITENVTINNYRTDCNGFETKEITSSIGLGSLSRMVTPSGAIVDYSYSLDSANEQVRMAADEIPAETITKKKITHDNNTTDSWTYVVNPTGGGVINPDGTWAAEASYSHRPEMPAYSYGRAGLVYRSMSSGVIVERHWTMMPFTGASLDSPGGTVSFNPVVDAEYTTLLDAQGNDLRMSSKTFVRDYNGNVTQVKEYDWVDLTNPSTIVNRDAQGVPTGLPSGSVLLRTTDTTYHNSPASASSTSVYAKRVLATGTPLFLNAPRETSVGTSRTRISYDAQAFGTAPTAGNVTAVSILDDRGDTDPSNDTWVTTGSTYGAYGNRSTATDAKGNVTQFFYEDSTHALPTRVVSDPQNGTGQQTTKTVYDFSTGMVTKQTDANNQVSDIDYTNQLLGTIDPLGRPGVMLSPVVMINGTSHRRKTFTFYHDATRRVRVEADLNAEGDRLLKSRETRDELGRTVLTEASEGGSNYTISAQTVYLEMGRIVLSSNPKRMGDSTSAEGWTRVTKDTAGRISEVSTFFGSAQPPSNGTNSVPTWTGSVKTSYNGNETTVTDQQNKSRKSVTDALGRPITVIEDPGTGGLNLETHYTYDTLGNLRKVDQGGQLRFFMYDSLSRLVRAKNPEQDANANLNVTDPVTGHGQWSLGYSYDLNGNLSSRVDARNITSTYSYDGFNRNTTVNYSDTPDINPDITRVYDGATNGKGRFWHDYKGGNVTAGTQVEHRAIDAYDALGRPLAQRQHFKTGNVWSAEYAAHRTYYLGGHVKTQTYPSGHTVSYSQDEAGRTNGFTGNLGDGAARTYSTGITYDAAGRITREQFGTLTALHHKRHYNSRGQLYDVRLAAASDEWAWDRGAVIAYYDSGYRWSNTGGQATGPDNNGNVTKAQVWVPGDEAVTTYSLSEDYYSYDSLNRLSSTNEYRSGTGVSNTPVFTQAFTYDRWGNRQINAGLTTDTLNEKQFDERHLASRNRLYAPGDLDAGKLESQRLMRYDPAGNLTEDIYTGAGARTYDAENHMTGAVIGINSSAAYSYDAEGRRVRRSTPTENVWQVYGFDGELLAEYAANAPFSSPQKEYGYRGGELLVTAKGSSSNSPAVYLSDLNWSYAATDYYPTTKDLAVAGTPQTLNGTTYTKGLGVHANSEVRYALGGNYESFASDVGVDDHTGALGSVTFEVWADGVKLYDSGVMTGATATKSVTVGVLGKQELKLVVTQAGDGPSYDHADWAGARLVTAPPAVNVAAASQGATASASSVYPYGTYTAAATINGDRKGVNWGAGGGWNDGTPDTYPDWVEVQFAGMKTIDEIDVFTGQDNYANPSEPTATQTFTLYGLTGFEVQYYNDSTAQWVTVQGGSVTGNNLVWRKFTFPAVTTSKIRVYTIAGLASYSRLTEIEAYESRQAVIDAKVQWLVTDHLGTPRMISGLSGSLSGMKRHDYLPFGEELFAGTGGRTSGQGYVADNVRQQFTGYERDDETGLDYAQARYYASTQGRFAGVDPLLASGRAASPQTWNRYAYAVNNPLRYTDPTGMNAEDIGTAEDQEREKKAQQPAPPPPPSQPAPAQNQIPTTMSIEGQQPSAIFNGVVDGQFITGVGTILQLTPKDQNGNPIPNVTVIESVSSTVTVNGRVEQNTVTQNLAPVTSPDGVVSDVVALAPPSPTRVGLQEGRNMVRTRLDTPITLTQEHRMTIISPTGQMGLAVHQRTLSNVGADGNVRPYTRLSEGNYTINHPSSVQVKQVPLIICPRF